MLCGDIFEEYKNANKKYFTEINGFVRYLYLISQSFASRGGVYGYGTTTKS